MSQSIDQERLRAAAEQLEEVLLFYAGQERVEALRQSLAPLIEAAKAGLVVEPLDRTDFPARHALAEREYADLESPSVEEALVAFSVELRGGLTAREKRLIAELDAAWQGDKR